MTAPCLRYGRRDCILPAGHVAACRYRCTSPTCPGFPWAADGKVGHPCAGQTNDTEPTARVARASEETT